MPKIVLCKYLKNSIHIKAKITRHLRKITFEIIQNISNVVLGMCGTFFGKCVNRYPQKRKFTVYALHI
jgi:hypothetical protein